MKHNITVTPELTLNKLCLVKAVLSLNHREVIYTLLVYKILMYHEIKKLNRKPTFLFIQATLHNSRNFWFLKGKEENDLLFSLKMWTQAISKFYLTCPKVWLFWIITGISFVINHTASDSVDNTFMHSEI